MKIKTWNIEAMTGYKPFTTFYEDFSIADHWGRAAVIDTFNRAFESWKGHYKYLTEFIMALNWKIWEHNESNPILAECYNELWQKAARWAEENLQGDELAYYYNTTD